MSGFPLVIVTLNPKLYPRDDSEIVLNPRALTIARGMACVWFRAHGGRTPASFALCSTLIARRGDIILWREIEDIMWSDREDGGPLSGRLQIQQQMFRVKDRLQRLGLCIDNWHSVGCSASLLPAQQARRAA